MLGVFFQFLATAARKLLADCIVFLFFCVVFFFVSLQTQRYYKKLRSDTPRGKRRINKCAVSFLLCKGTDALEFSASLHTMTVVWEVAKSDQELDLRRLVPPSRALSLIWDMDWIWTKLSLWCFKIQSGEGDNHFTPPPNKTSPCNDGLCSREYISQLCSHAWLVWQAFWCFGAIWITLKLMGCWHMEL